MVSAEERLDRRQQLQRRLERANRIEQAVEQACSGPIFDGLTLDQIDHDGTLRHSVRALVTTVPQQVPELDVVLYRGPHSPWGLRIVVAGDDVEILPIQVGGVAGLGTVAPETQDFSQVAGLAAAMWQNR